MCMKRRIFSIVTALALCLSLFPAWAFAEEADIGAQEEADAGTQEEADGDGAPMPLETDGVLGDVVLDGIQTVKFTAGACGGSCQGHKITQTSPLISGREIYVESGVHDVTFSGLNLQSLSAGVAPGGTMNLTIEGENTITNRSASGIYVPVDATFVINGGANASLNVSSNREAGIGGSAYIPWDSMTEGDLNCGTVVINGGTITVSGGNSAAGIGGTSNRDNFGNGGAVTATSGDGAPGIGGAVFGTKKGGDGSLTIASPNVLGSGTTLGPDGNYVLTEPVSPTEDMIVAPDLEYTGQELDTSGIYIDTSKETTVTVCGREFQAKASADGWVKSFDPSPVQEVGEYTVTFTKDGDSIQKTFKVAGCLHQGDSHLVPVEGTETHRRICGSCGAEMETEDCAFGSFAYQDADNHKAVCACGREKLLAHDWKIEHQMYPGDGEGSYLYSRTCQDCRHSEEMGSLIFKIPQSRIPYGQTAGKQISITGDFDKLGVTEIYWTYQTAFGEMELTDRGEITPVCELSAGLSCGSHVYKVYWTFDGNREDFICGIKVTPVALPEDKITLSPESAVYNGTEQKPTVTIDGLYEIANFTVDYSSGDFTNGGEHTVSITGVGNYEGTVQKTFTITPAPVEVESGGYGIATGTYGQKLSELTVVEGTPVVRAQDGTEVSGRWKLTGDTIPNVKDRGPYEAVFTPLEANNYQSTTGQVLAVIDRAPGLTPRKGTMQVRNNQQRTYTYNLEQLLPDPGEGLSLGDVSYRLDAVNLNSNYYNASAGEAKINGNTLTLPIRKYDSESEHSIGEIGITIISGNYEPMTAAISVESVNKTPVTVTGVTAQDAAYNGGSHTGCTGTPAAGEYTGTFTYTYAKADGTALDGPPVEVGSYTVTISVPDSNEDYTGSTMLSFKIEKARVTIKADDKSVTTGGAMPALTYTVTGLAGGDTLKTEPDLSCGADLNTVGSYAIEVSGGAVPDGGNYQETITYQPGTLTVKNPPSGGGDGGGKPTVHVTGVRLNKSTLVLTAGSSERLTATVTPVDADNQTVSWASSNPDVAAVGRDGTVTALRAGTAVITVTTTDGGKTASCTVTVNKRTPVLALTATPAMLPGGGTVTLALTGLPEGGTAAVTCSDGSIPVTKGSGSTWTATLPAGGTSYTFTASYAGDESHNSATASCTVNVDLVTPTLSLTASPASLTGGGTVTLALTGLPEGGTASVTCSGGIPVMKGTGNTWTATLPNSSEDYTFTASYAGDNSHRPASAACTVKVKETVTLPDQPNEGGEQFRLVMETGISEVPTGLQGIETLNTPEKLETAMRAVITQATPGIPQANTIVYDVTLLVSTDNGATWVPATKDNFPSGGLTITLPYPSGTDSRYRFTVAHMFTTSDFGKTPAIRRYSPRSR